MIEYANTLDPLVLPVTVEEFADYSRSDPTDPALEPILTQATQSVIRHIRRDLNIRNWVLRYHEWPYSGTLSKGLAPSSAKLLRSIRLPYADYRGSITINSVHVNGEATTDYRINGDFIEFDTVTITDDFDTDALVVDYDVGYNPIPAEITGAILLLATYLLTHRGCDASNAIMQSGASEALEFYNALQGDIF